MGNVMESKERVFDLRETEGTPRLTIHQMNGDINIQAWDRPEIRLEISEDDLDIDDAFRIQQHGNEISINMEWGHERRHEQHRRQERHIASQIEDAFREGDFAAIGEQISALVGRYMGPRPDVDLEVRVPANCDLAVRTISGAVEIHGVTGNIYLETASGDVNLQEVTANVIGKSASGGFEVHRFNGRLGLRTASGEVSVTAGLLQAFNLGTVSGDVTLAGRLAPDGEYAVRTTSGDVHLGLPRDTQCLVKIRTVSGDVDCALPYDRERESRRQMSLAINGGGPVLQFGSVSGDLSITELDREYMEAREAPAAGAAELGATQRLRGDGSAEDEGDGEAFRVEGGGRPTGALDAESQAPRQTAEMAVLEAIERGEMTVDEGLQRLAELRHDF